ncbi:MAG: bactofilin family protein [Candidatus Aquicultorales bacterium]
MFNYLLLLAGFFLLVAVCFVPGFIELRWPKDAGPIHIDLDRDIDERYFSRAFKSYVAEGLRSPDVKQVPSKPEDSRWMHGLQAQAVQTAMHRGPESFVLSVNDVQLPAVTECRQGLLVSGTLTTGPSCRLSQEVQVKGDCTIGKSNQVLCVAGNNIDIGPLTKVAGWVDAGRNLIVRDGSEISSRATAGESLAAVGTVTFKSLAAPIIVTAPDQQEAERLLGERETSEAMPQASPDFRWSRALDQIIINRFDNSSVIEIGEEIRMASGRFVPYRSILARANALGLIAKPLLALKDEQKPSFMRSLKVWLQAPEMLRVKGDLSIPENSVVPCDLYVVGDVKTGKSLEVEGSVSAQGTVKLGDDARVKGSVVAEHDIEIGAGSRIGQCVDANGSIVVHSRTLIGSTGLGGVASRETIFLSHGVKIFGKAYAEAGIRVGPQAPGTG